MGDIVIVGAGYAGLAAARALAGRRAALDGRRVLVVDAKKTFDILPLLPDVASKRLSKESAALDLKDYLDTLGVNFEHSEVTRVDLESREVFLKGGGLPTGQAGLPGRQAGVLSYEFLILSPGVASDFSTFPDGRRRFLKMDTVEDASVVAGAVSTYPEKKIVIASGGGFGGVETASALASLLRRKHQGAYEMHLITRDEDILPSATPLWMRDYCRMNLSALGVGIHLRCGIKSADEHLLKLTNGLELEDYLLVWCADVGVPEFVRALPVRKDACGRIVVDERLAFEKNCFAAGDAVSSDVRPGLPAGQAGMLRRGVPFAMAEGAAAAGNILRLIAGQRKLSERPEAGLPRLLRYRPRPLPLFMVMANKRACGCVLNLRLKGGWVWGLLHFLFAALAPVPKQRLKILFEVFFKR